MTKTRNQSSPISLPYHRRRRNCLTKGVLSWFTRLLFISLGMGIGVANSESGNGVETVLGNSMNISSGRNLKEKDPNGLGIVEFTRSPTGFLVTRPNLPKEPSKNEYGWLESGFVEAGGLAVSGDQRNAQFLQYRDLRNGGYLNRFELQLEKPETASFVDASGGGTGRNDQFYGLSFGRYNDWRIRTFYNETGHVFTSSYRSLWNGIGSEKLTLIGLPAGGSVNAATTDINIGNAAMATPYSTLSVTRNKGGVRFDKKITDDWTVFASYSAERRIGARPFGMVSGGGGGTGGVETAESINYRTIDMLGGLQYAGQFDSLNLSIASSMFRNKIDTMSVENPMFLIRSNNIGQFPRAVYDLYPNNDFYNAKAEYARSLPTFFRGYFTALVSASRSRQNASLIPSTPYAGAAVNGVAGGAWDTPASLSRQSANASIDSSLADFSLSLKPATGLDIKGKVRHYETRNALDYLACNPLTGQWGRLINDGSADAIVNTPAYLQPNVRCNVAATAALGLAPSAGNVNIRAIPFDYKQRNYSFGADYRAGKSATVSATLEREEFDRSFRERAKTHEDKLKLAYVNRGLEKGTIRLSFENDRRRGSPYIADPYNEFYSSSLGPLPTDNFTPGELWIRTNNLHRKYDLADRNQNILNAKFNYMLAPDLDLGTSLQSKDIKYPDSQLGRSDRQRLDSFNLDLNWQPAAAMSLYGNYGFQSGSMNQASIQPNDCTIGLPYNFLSNGAVQGFPLSSAQVAAGLSIIGTRTVTAANFVVLCGTVSPTSPLFPSSQTWKVSHRDTNHFLTVGGNVQFAKARWDLNYTFAQSVTAIRYAYNAAALGITPAQAALAGDGFPDLTYRRNTLESNLIVPMSQSLSVRLLYRYEIGRIRDWHYDGFAQNPTPSNNQQTYLDTGPQNYRASVVGLFLSLGL